MKKWKRRQQPFSFTSCDFAGVRECSSVAQDNTLTHALATFQVCSQRKRSYIPSCSHRVGRWKPDLSLISLLPLSSRVKPQSPGTLLPQESSCFTGAHLQNHADHWLMGINTSEWDEASMFLVKFTSASAANDKKWFQISRHFMPSMHANAFHHGRNVTWKYKH